MNNIGIPKHKKHLQLLSSLTKLFITFELKVFRHKERDTQSSYADFSICPPTTTTCDIRRKASASSESQPSSSEARTQLSDFSQISTHASSA